MSIRDNLRTGASPYLVSGEQIQAVFLVKRPRVRYNDRAVVATDRRLLLLELNSFGRPTGMLAEAARNSMLGPCRGFLQSIDAFGTPLAVNQRFFKDVLAADQAAGFYDSRAAPVTHWAALDDGSPSDRPRIGLVVGALLLGFIVVLAVDFFVANALGVPFSDIGWWQVLPNIAAFPLAIWAVRTVLLSTTGPVRTPWRWLAYIGIGLATLYVAFFTLPMEAMGICFFWSMRPTPASRAERDNGRTFTLPTKDAGDDEQPTRSDDL